MEGVAMKVLVMVPKGANAACSVASTTSEVAETLAMLGVPGWRRLLVGKATPRRGRHPLPWTSSISAPRGGRPGPAASLARGRHARTAERSGDGVDGGR